MRGLIYTILVYGAALIVIFSFIMVIGIALAHYPFTFKDFARDFREICKGLYEGENPKNERRNHNGKHREERDHHH